MTKKVTRADKMHDTSSEEGLSGGFSPYPHRGRTFNEYAALLPQYSTANALDINARDNSREGASDPLLLQLPPVPDALASAERTRSSQT